VAAALGAWRSFVKVEGASAALGRGVMDASREQSEGRRREDDGYVFCLCSDIMLD